MGAHKPGPEGIPNSLADEGGSEDERVGEDEHVGAPGLDVALMRMGPWNRKALPSHNGSGSETRCNCCPRRMGGNFVDC